MCNNIYFNENSNDFKGHLITAGGTKMVYPMEYYKQSRILVSGLSGSV
jgi:hypothetical protein